MIASLFIASLALADAAIPNGTFRQPCQQGYQREEIIQGNAATFGEKNFADSGCKAPSLTVRSYGYLAYGGPLASPAGAAALDFEFSRVTMTPDSDAVAAIYQRESLCGLTGWKAGVELEITGRACDLYGQGHAVQIPAPGETRYGIYRVNSDGSLSFGGLSPERDGSRPGLRPGVWDPVSYLPVAPASIF